MKKHINIITSSILTISIIALLVFAGPASGFVISLDIDKEDEDKEEKKIKFTATIDLETIDQNLPIELITLNIFGPTNDSCSFNITGKETPDCNNFKIKAHKFKINKINNSFGYGYGYDSESGFGYTFGYGNVYNGPQTFQYKITLDTEDYKEGDYETELVVKIGNKTFIKQGKDFTIKKKKKPGKDDNDETEDGHHGNGGSGNGGSPGDGKKSVLICHIPKGNTKASHTIKVSQSALKAHLNHGDYEGKCANNSQNSQFNQLSVNNNQQNNKQEDKKEQEKEIKQEIKTEKPKGKIARITGGVIGATATPAGLGFLIVLMIGIVVIELVLIIKRNKSTTSYY